jgi:hypothetical protein
MALKNKIIDKIGELGFRENCIMETILVTKNEDESLNPAPMGVSWIGGFLMEIKPYKSSTTFQNLQRNDVSYLNIINDPYIFLVAAFKDEFQYDFEFIGHDLKDSEASLSLEKFESFELSGDRFSFLNKVKDIKIYHAYPRVFSRGTSEAIEAVVHATRVKVYKKQGKCDKADHLEDKIWECIRLIKRISGEDSPEMRVVDKIKDLLKVWSGEI